MTSETFAPDQLQSEPTFEIPPATLEQVLQPDEILAAEVLDGAIRDAETNHETDADTLTLLRFQRSMVDMSPEDARIAAISFVRETGKYARFNQNTLPSLHFPVDRGLVVGSLADQQRWKIIGIDPSQYGNDAYANAYRKALESSWREAMRARQNLAGAQAAEAEAMERASNPPVFVPIAK